MPFPPFDEYDEFGRLRMPLFAPQTAVAQNYSPVQASQVAPINQIQQTGQSFSQVSPTMLQGALNRTPNFDPRPVTPRALTPAEQESYPIPRREDYAPTRLRTILNAIVAGGVGIKDPKFGFQLGSELSDRPYNQAVERYQALTADQKRRIGIEKEARSDAEQAAERGIKAGTAQENELWKDSTLDINRYKARTGEERAQGYLQDTASKIERRKASINFDKWKQDNPKLDDFQYILATDDPEEQAARLKSYKEFKSASEKDLQRIEDESKARAEGTAKGNLTPSGIKAAELLPGVKTESSTTGRIKAETTPEAIDAQAKLTRARSLATLTTNEKDTITGATHALQAFPDIRSQLPTASNKIFGNRWQDFVTGKLGTDPEFAPLRLNLGMLQSLTAKLHVGSRGSVHILNKFETLFNAKEMDRDTLAASLDELEKWLTRYSKMPRGTDPSEVDTNAGRPAIRVNGRELK